MKILFLGTAAAEGIPGLFCRCPVCLNAREKGGREIRTRSGAMIDGKLKLDFGPDSFWHLQRYGLDYLDMRSVLITHSHADHLNPAELECRFPGYCYTQDGTAPENPLTIYGNEAVGRTVEPYTRHPSGSLAFRKMTPFEPVQVEDYTVTALEAVHCCDPDGTGYPVRFRGRTVYRTEDALIYLIEKDGQSILYAHDTDEFSEANMEYLAGRQISLISLDCTSGRIPSRDIHWIGHMTSEDCLRLREKLIATGAAGERTRFVANHFSHNGYSDYEDMERITPGFIISYDGLVIDLSDGKGAAVGTR